MRHYLHGTSIHRNQGGPFVIRGILFFVIAVTTVYQFTTTAAAVTPPDSCFAFSAGTITDYYDTENNDPGQPACPRNVDIPPTVGGDAVTILGDNAFNGKSLTAVTIPDSVATIGAFVFYDNQLSTLFLPNSVTSSGQNLVGLNPITSITIGTKDFSGTPVFDLWAGVLASAPTLAEITIGNNVVAIGSGALQNMQLTSLTIPNSVTAIGSGISSGTPLVSLTIGTSDFTGTPNTVIAPNAFGGISTLAEVTLGENITTINPVAFLGNAIESITIPASVMNIGFAAFANNPLKYITILGNPTILQSSFWYNLSPSSIPGGLSGEDLARYYQDNAEYVRMYASDPNFIAAHSPGSTYTETYGANTYVISGYVLNPATYSVSYESSTGDTLAPQFVSGTGPTLTNYSIAANPLADFSLYYTAGDNILLEPLTISGYNAPVAHNLVFMAGSNAYTFLYAGGELADTGMNQQGWVGFALFSVLSGVSLTAGAFLYIRNQSV